MNVSSQSHSYKKGGHVDYGFYFFTLKTYWL